MRSSILIAALSVAGLVACDKPTVVNTPAPVVSTPAPVVVTPPPTTAVMPVPVPGPAGPEGPKGEPGKTGDTTVVVTPPAMK